MPRSQLNSALQSEIDNMSVDEMLLTSFNKIKKIRANLKEISAEMTDRILEGMMPCKNQSTETLEVLGEFNAAIQNKS